jgi:hypothetical protein
MKLKTLPTRSAKKDPYIKDFIKLAGDFFLGPVCVIFARTVHCKLGAGTSEQNVQANAGTSERSEQSNAGVSRRSKLLLTGTSERSEPIFNK